MQRLAMFCLAMQVLTQAEQEIQLTLEVNAGDSLYLKPEDYITGITNDVGDVCRQDTNENMHMSQGAPQGVSFRNVAHDVGFRSRQAKVKTSPNCIFPQWDKKLRRWDAGGFCMEETLTGGACIGDANGDGYDDLYYPRMDGSDILYINRKDGSGFDDSTKLSNLYLSRPQSTVV